MALWGQLIYFLAASYYSLQLFSGCAKIIPYETITERTEKWAAPTFLLVMHSAATLTELKI
jgi:hypothetical protein